MFGKQFYCAYFKLSTNSNNTYNLYPSSLPCDFNATNNETTRNLNLNIFQSPVPETTPWREINLKTYGDIFAQIFQRFHIVSKTITIFYICCLYSDKTQTTFAIRHASLGCGLNSQC